MKKGQMIEGVIEKVEFPDKGIVFMEDGKPLIVRHAILGQRVLASVNKVRKGKCEGRLIEVLEKSPLELEQPACSHFGSCGGCAYQSISYEQQLLLKSGQVKNLIDAAILPTETEYKFSGIRPSPKEHGYRNKMEFSFGDEWKDGPLALGMHKRGSFYDIVNVPECRIVDEDFRKLLSVTLAYFKERNIPYYHKLRHTGYLRHLLVRKAEKTGEILVALVTTGRLDLGEQRDGSEVFKEQRDRVKVLERELIDGWKSALLSEYYQGALTGILHIVNDSVADTITNEGTEILYGQDYFYEELLGLRFKITPFSFFQTNSSGAEVLYETARGFIQNALGDDKVVFDLYSGTGTIAQMLAPVAKKVIGVEIVEEAVEAARENASLNGLRNCQFIAGDVLKVLDGIEERPDLIVLDPPREGIHPKALEKITCYGVPQMVYISCKPTSLARDIVKLQEYGYRVEKVCCVDMFPGTVHVETICALSRIK